jgi:hypothetical protein
MRAFRILAAFCAISILLFAAENPFVGTWKLNNKKSTFAPATETKEMKVVFEVAGGQVRRVATGIDSDGEPISETSTIAWDGKDHLIDGPGMTVAVVQSGNSNTIDVTVKHEGKVMEKVKLTVSKNGKTMTAIAKGFNQKQRPVNNTEIFDRQ